LQALNIGAGFGVTLPVRSTTALEYALAGVRVARTEADVDVFEADADARFDDAKTEAHADVVDAEAGVVNTGFNFVEDDFFCMVSNQSSLSSQEEDHFPSPSTHWQEHGSVKRYPDRSEI
jgi:hypothetical protein